MQWHMGLSTANSTQLWPPLSCIVTNIQLLDELSLQLHNYVQVDMTCSRVTKFLFITHHLWNKISERIFDAEHSTKEHWEGCCIFWGVGVGYGPCCVVQADFKHNGSE